MAIYSIVPLLLLFANIISEKFLCFIETLLLGRQLFTDPQFFFNFSLAFSQTVLGLLWMLTFFTQLCLKKPIFPLARDNRYSSSLDL